jgi:hypothetical protein
MVEVIARSMSYLPGPNTAAVLYGMEVGKQLASSSGNCTTKGRLLLGINVQSGASRRGSRRVQQRTSTARCRGKLPQTSPVFTGCQGMNRHS